MTLTVGHVTTDWDALDALPVRSIIERTKDGELGSRILCGWLVGGIVQHAPLGDWRVIRVGASA